LPHIVRVALRQLYPLPKLSSRCDAHFAKPSSRRKSPALSPAGLRLYVEVLGDSTATYDIATSALILPAGKAVEPTRMKKVQRKPTLKQKLARQAQTDKRMALVEALANSRRRTGNDLFALAQKESLLQAKEALVVQTNTQYFKIRLSGLAPDNELVVEVTKCREQLQRDVEDAAAAVEKLEHSVEQAKVEEARLERALAILDQGRSNTSPPKPHGPLDLSGYDSALSNTPSSTDQSQHLEEPEETAP